MSTYCKLTGTDKDKDQSQNAYLVLLNVNKIYYYINADIC